MDESSKSTFASKSVWTGVIQLIGAAVGILNPDLAAKIFAPGMEAHYAEVATQVASSVLLVTGTLQILLRALTNKPLHLKKVTPNE